MATVVGKVTQTVRQRFNESPKTYRAFAAGFVAGQAEKVYLGVCAAAMFRPSPENFGWHLEEVLKIAEDYGLKATILPSHAPEAQQEIWIHRGCYSIGDWLNHEVNSEGWHRLRAQACGIPITEIDLRYDQRDGYGQLCD